MPSDTGL